MGGVFCHKFDAIVGGVSFLQQIVPQSLAENHSGFSHSAFSGELLGIAEASQKVRQRVYWPGSHEEVQLSVFRCAQCQKRRNPAKTHHHALVDSKTSYSSHPIGLYFMGPLPESNGHEVIFLIGDLFTKLYDDVPLPNQQASTTTTALIDQSNSRLSCLHSRHGDHTRIFEP